MNKTVDTAVKTNEHTKVSDRLDCARDFVAFIERCCEFFPWVHCALLDTQRNTTTLFINIKNHNFNFITNLNNFRWVNVFVSPIHF